MLPDSSMWWIAAGLAVAMELATGTLYLLMLALGMAAAAVVAHLGGAVALQLGCGAAVAAVATLLLHWRRSSRPRAVSAAADRDVNLDVGDAVHVSSWKADGSARVQHRGSLWTAHLAPGQLRRSGAHTVVGVERNVLVLAPRSDAPEVAEEGTSLPDR